jgi:hypothetical protein
MRARFLASCSRSRDGGGCGDAVTATMLSIVANYSRIWRLTEAFASEPNVAALFKAAKNSVHERERE